jgi:hypothetical protein
MSPSMPRAELYAHAIHVINGLEQLKPRWNGHGASPIAEDVRDAAIGFLREIAVKFGPPVPEPSVGPTSDGGVFFEWQLTNPARLFQIVLLPKGQNEYSLRDVAHDHLLRADEELSRGELLELVRSLIVDEQLLRRA